MRAPLGKCTFTGCEERTASGRCPKHKKHADRARGNANSRGYTYRWSQASQRHLEHYPLCGMRSPEAESTVGWRGECYERKRTTEAECTDHIVASKFDEALHWDPKNWQSLCFKCNTIKAIRYEGGLGHNPRHPKDPMLSVGFHTEI